MKKIKFLYLIILFLLISLFLSACLKPDNPNGGGNGDGEVGDLEYKEGTELKLAVTHNSTATTISFEDSKIIGEGLKLADGTTYQLGDLKPVWKELQNKLKLKFTNVYSGASSAKNEYTTWKSLDFKGVDIVVGDADDITVDGRSGKIVDLSKYLDKMPNFKKFLEENPIVYLSIVSDVEKGSIYYAPYFDGYNDIEKYYLMRIDWVEKLLDGKGDFVATTSDKFGDICKKISYEPYMPTSASVKVESLNSDGTDVIEITKNYDTKYGNIIDYMNKNIKNETTGVEMVNILRNYIDEAYDGYYGEKRSNLFCGYDACWDADELVALLRCVVCNTYALTGQNQNKVTGIFPRESSLNRTTDLLSLASMFGIRGTESRNGFMYFNKEGKLSDARGQVDYNEAIHKLNELYKEGLILQNFDTYEGTINKDMYQKNLGFMLYDYLQTQTIYNMDKTTLDKNPNFKLSAVINPVAKWDDGESEKYMRFTESWRSVKTNGWCISSACTGEKLNAALTLFDYMYSDEGSILMSYGPSSWRSGKTISYKGEDIPELSSAALDELWNLAGGNYTNYARQYLGSTLPVGFVKDQGMEYQSTTEGGKEGALKVSTAISKGVLKHVSPTIEDNLFYTMVPTVLPTSIQEDEIIGKYAALSDSGLYSKQREKYNIYIDVLKNGFGSNVNLSSTILTKMPASAKELSDYFVSDTAGGNAYLTIQSNAWDKILKYYQDNFKK